MSECEKAKIIGYIEQTPAQISLINLFKQLEIDTLAIIEAAKRDCAIANMQLDQRWISIAKTHIQEASMALVRAAARPNGD